MSGVEITESMQAIALSHASRLSRRFPMVQRDDIVQEQYVWLLQHPRKVKKWLGDDDEIGHRRVSRAMRNAALTYCHREKAAATGYEVDDLYFYSVPLLRKLMPTVFDRESWLRLGRTEMSSEPLTRGDPAEGNNVLAVLVDISTALRKIPLDQFDALRLAFKEDLDDTQLAGIWQCTPDAARMRVNRALRRVQEYLGGERPDTRLADEGDDKEWPR